LKLALARRRLKHFSPKTHCATNFYNLFWCWLNQIDQKPKSSIIAIAKQIWRGRMLRSFYYVIVDGQYLAWDLWDLVKFLRSQNPRPLVWSARLSTGLFGLTNCPAGNRGPKNKNEVLLAIGNDGLNQLINLGFITCPVCRPENMPNFWAIAREAVFRKYSIRSFAGFTNKDILPYDARRVDWEKIIPVVRQWPNRLYVPRGLSEKELRELKSRIQEINFGFPLVGYYDASSPGGFVQFQL
jgi:hypothetical protein